MSEQLLFPPGRIVYGSVDKARTTDFQGNPLTVKTGANAGQPTQKFEFGVAIRKGAESGWWETPWGQTVFTTAQAGFPGGETQRPNFSWKITDGDSQVPNQNNVTPASKEGYPGHWVVSFSTALPVSRHAIDPATGKPVDIVQDGEIVPGYFVEVYGSVAANGNSQKPGVFLNPQMVCRIAYGERIISGPTAEQAGFGAAVAPQGAMAAPPASAVPMQQPAPAMVPGQPVAPAAVPGQPGYAPGAVAPAAVPGMLLPGQVVPGQPVAPAAVPGAVPGQVVPGMVQQPAVVATAQPGAPAAQPVPQPGMLYPQQ